MYAKMADLIKVVKAVRDQLITTDVNQYVYSKDVNQKDFEEIEDEVNRKDLPCAVIFQYDAQINHIIIKLADMGTTFHELTPLGATTFGGRTTSCKEGDSTFKNAYLRGRESDWPHLVIETGVSESLRELRRDTGWWLSNSEGEVLVVVVIHITRATKTIVMETYIPEFPSPWLKHTSVLPRLVSETVIDFGSKPPRVKGGSVVLEFH
ncbi:uncharacterized protein KD926_004456 [Aspergillus affinis]|uniref:uncharacterized protein n=1 Tax=Aspergillus affinis TaxID=1070780 RepID=UPI0022FE8784|nr:uncharacterized protein KD926_004456 [Aspergillus affinis]KAI9035161.1 hypothetical protein KD926_004456 [Aspergillus affinis]